VNCGNQRVIFSVDAQPCPLREPMIKGSLSTNLAPTGKKAQCAINYDFISALDQTQSPN
jgi:hypothetical protein